MYDLDPIVDGALTVARRTVAVHKTASRSAAFSPSALRLRRVVSGLASASPLGWGLATLAAWGLLATWLLAWTAWPILVDPARADQPVVARLRLAALLVLAHPIRIGLLGIVLGLFLAVSTLAVVALATVSVAFSALVASRFILPAADRLEARLASDEAVNAPTPDAP